MKRLFILLLCNLLTLCLGSCTILPASNTYFAASGDNALGSLSNSDAASHKNTTIKLSRIKDELTAEDGHVLVSFSYDHPTIAIPGNPTAEQRIQKSLDNLMDQELAYIQDKLLPVAKEAYQNLGNDARPCTAELNLTVQRVDDTVISVVADDIRNSGSVQDGDLRSGWNYDAQTGELLTFSSLGKAFRDTASALVTTQTDQHTDSLYKDYRSKISHVVLDGTENAQAVFGYETTIAPTFYFTSDSIVFISREYELQPCEMGVLEFPILYSDFGSALDRRYLPNGYTPNSTPDQAPDSSEIGFDSDQSGFSTEEENLTLLQSGKLQCDRWALTIPVEWGNQVYVEHGPESVSFFERGCYSEMGGGWLFSIEAYTNDEYLNLPDYGLLSIDQDTSYVVVYPTDIQFEGASTESAQRYSAFFNQIENVLHSFTLFK